ncbi:MAG: DUF2330 domain-containing protein [Deltaproteobacteria bacterium]|nr:DUF2330 domain-containing protein [Deltaproteobacteria bacterium]
MSLAAAAMAAATLQLAAVQQAEACGCFTPPDPTVPIVQAGERIAFAMEDGKVTSHIQIQYSGPAEQFGWLLPLPSIPDLQVGTDELFTNLINSTQPRYRLVSEFHGNCAWQNNRGGGFGGGSPDSAGENESPPGDDGPGVLVVESSVGPYDYAVLRADSKEPMLEWLDENGYFVPAGTDEAVDAYIRPGAYFLALRLQKGNEVGDLQPVVVEYASDLPMIPIVLTSVAADPDMGVQVWVLGDHRAIPRNYFHTHINDALLDWLNGAQNYVSVLTDAVDEADGHHSFVTEYAGGSDRMVGLLDWEGRFGSVDQLASITEAVQFVQYLRSNGYPFNSILVNILDAELPVPSALEAQGITPAQYLSNLDWYLGSYKDQNPELFEDLDVDFNPVTVAASLDERIRTPTLEAGQMFRDNPYMTRMFTTLSPDEMTKDPVFSFNPDLEAVDNEHEGRLIYHCGLYSENQSTTPVTIVTENGNNLYLPDGTNANPWLGSDMPSSQRIEILREEGPPEVVTDNDDVIRGFLGMSGCSVAGGGSAGWMVVALFALVAIRRRRRS